MTSEQFSKLALSFPATEEAAHFDRTAYKVIGRRIFATLHEASQSANLKLSLVNQSVYHLLEPAAIYPVANKWGLQGWTAFELKQCTPAVMLDALAQAHKEASVKKR